MKSFRNWQGATITTLALACLCVTPAQGEFTQDGLVLWLDSGEADRIVRDDAGRVSAWLDKSSFGHRAVQQQAARRPEWGPDPYSGRPVIRFRGNEVLNLGCPEVLAFGPPQPFTMAVAFRVERSQCGTFLAQGGGSTADRAFQFYVAPGRLGAITYGSDRHEKPIGDGWHVAVLSCDGANCQVFLGHDPWFSFRAGNVHSAADTLIGARRRDADNTGTAYELTGSIGEVVVYARQLNGPELKELQSCLIEKYESDELGRLAEEDAFSAAERLWQISQAGHLSETQLAVAAELLSDRDPFVRGLAEWAIATKVGSDNNGERISWPRRDAPEWFCKWLAASEAYDVESDYVRQAAVLGLLHDSDALLESASAATARAEKVAKEVLQATKVGSAQVSVAEQLARLHAIRDRLSSLVRERPDDCSEHRRLWLDLRLAARPIVLANPAVDFEEILFLKRHAPHTARNITRSLAWKHKPGGDICVLSGFQEAGSTRQLIQGQLGPGYVWGLDLWWDGDRVVFSYARQPDWPPPLSTVAGDTTFELRKLQEPLHLFEINTNGSGLRQLTDDPYWSDFEPTYCANGNIIFTSDRCARAAECGSFPNDIPNPNLYVASPDGRDIRRLTDSKDVDRYPHSLDNGLIAYTHWEYQERHFMEVHALWTARPDGTMADALFKQHLPAPLGLRDTRSVPGSAKLISIATGHHTFANGPVVLIDPRWGLNDVRGLTIVTPGVVPQEGPMAGQPVPQGGVPDRGGLYRTPWALSETCFLAAYGYPRVTGERSERNARADSNGFGIYLIDVYGNKELLHRDPLYASSFPIPLKPRRRPPELPTLAAAPSGTKGKAVCYVPDVYEGMLDVPRGSIKYIRVSQHVAWPWDADRGKMPYLPDNAYSRQFGYWSWSPVRVIGEVPVDKDGSAHFEVPADTALYFQALDERHMEIRRMRSMVSLQHGEVRGCRGCHESQARAPQTRAWGMLASLTLPQRLEPPPWGAERLLGYEALVQPILDGHCVECHDSERPEGGVDLSATRASDGFLQSFRTMFGRRPDGSDSGRSLVSCSDRFSDSSVTKAKQFGSHKSLLIRVLLDDELHRRDVKLNDSEWLTLVTWVDANAPYHDRFYDKRPTDGGQPRRDVIPQMTQRSR